MTLSLSLFHVIVVTIGFDPDSYSVNEMEGTVGIVVRILVGRLERSADIVFNLRNGSAICK